MATITTGAALYYKSGTSGVSAVVGYESKSNRVARYKFTAPSTGASSVSIRINNVSFGEGSKTSAIRFYITTSADSHINAGASAAYNGTLSLTSSNGTYDATGAANVLLLPNTVYYLWVFPGSTYYGWWYWNTPATLTTSGGAGLVYIDNGTKLVPAIPYIDTGTGWVQAMPYIDNGSTWVLCS